MDKIKIWLKKLNLLFTKTCEEETFYQKDFDINNIELNLDESISLYDLLESFNKMYLSFQEEYSKLKKITFGKEYVIGTFSKFWNQENELCRLLPIYVVNPSFTEHTETILYFGEMGDKIFSFAVNIPDSDSEYHEDIPFDKEEIRRYLTFFDKYALLFELFDTLKNKYLYADGINVLFSEIMNKDSVFDELDSITLRVCTSFWLGPENEICIKIYLGEVFGIDYQHSYLRMDDENIKVSMDQYMNILKGIYLNGDYLIQDKKPKEENIKCLKKWIK